MAQLIALKQRIKTVTTLKKTTNAMRLISMSNHTRIRQIKGMFTPYQEELRELYREHVATEPMLVTIESSEPTSFKPVFTCVLGSQKGVCGTFNTFLANFVQKTYEQRASTQEPLLIFGKQMYELVKEHAFASPALIGTISIGTLDLCVQELFDRIQKLEPGQAAVVYHNFPKSFFVQRPTQTFFLRTSDTLDPLKILVRDAYLRAELKIILIDSLLAEYSARFVSMDTSTQNADKVIAQLRLDYNKLRQASITRELIDLTSALNAVSEQ